MCVEHFSPPFDSALASGNRFSITVLLLKLNAHAKLKFKCISEKGLKIYRKNQHEYTHIHTLTLC